VLLSKSPKLTKGINALSVAEKDIAATPSDKRKRIEDTSSKDNNFDLRHLRGQQLFEEDIS
jgi:hypothetical protein